MCGQCASLSQGYDRSAVKPRMGARVFVWEQEMKCLSLTSQFHHLDIKKTHMPHTYCAHTSQTRQMSDQRIAAKYVVFFQ